MKSKFIFAILTIALISNVGLARELSSFVIDGKDSITYTTDTNKIEVSPNNGLVKATIQTTFGKPIEHGGFQIKFYVAKVTLDCKNFNGSFDNVDAYEGDPSTTIKAGTLVPPEPFKDGNGRGFLNKDIFTKVCQEAFPQSQQASIASKKLSPETSSSSANYCFTSVKGLNSCDAAALVALNLNSGTIKRFINNKTAIEWVTINPKPIDINFTKPGSPAYYQVLEDQKNYVPTSTFTVKLKLNGNTFEVQVGPNSNCYYKGTYRETKDIVEFDSKDLIGNCDETQKTIGKMALGKITYRKINY